MMNLEEEINETLEWSFYRFKNLAGYKSTPDFVVYVPVQDCGEETEITVWIEAKEKLQSVNTKNWPKTEIPEKYLFIIDELTARILMRNYPHAWVVVRDTSKGRAKYTVFDAISLHLMPHKRCKRHVGTKQGGTAIYKGKWMLDMRNGWQCDKIDDAIQHILDETPNMDKRVETLECYGDYVGEDIPKGGEARTKQHRRTDLDAARGVWA